MCSFNKSFMNYDFISYLFIYLQETKQRRQPKKAKLTNGRISSRTGQENPVPNGSKQNKVACSVFVMLSFFFFSGENPVSHQGCSIAISWHVEGKILHFY